MDLFRKCKNIFIAEGWGIQAFRCNIFNCQWTAEVLQKFDRAHKALCASGRIFD